MSDRPSRPAPPEPLFGDLRARLAQAPLAIAGWTGFTAAALSCLITIGVALLLWIPDADATATSTSIVHAGVLTFLMAMHGGAHLNGVHIGFVPLGMTLAAMAACARLGRPAWAHPQASGLSATRIVAAQAAAYTVTCGLLIPSARLGTTWLGWTGTLLGAAVVATVGFGCAAVRAGAVSAGHRVPTSVRVATRAALAALAVLLTGGAVLSTVATLVQHGRFTQLSRALAGGMSSVPIALLETLTAPNAVVAGSAFLAGPGFDVGAAHYGITGNQPAAVPAFPILSGLPATATAAPMSVLVLAVLTVLGAGLAAGWLAHCGTRNRGWRTGLGVAALAGLITGAAMAALSALSGGSLGAHALHSVGPSPLWTGVAVTGEIGAAAVLTGMATRGSQAVRSRRQPKAAAAAAPVPVPEPVGVSVAAPPCAATSDQVTVELVPAQSTMADEDLPRAAAS